MSSTAKRLSATVLLLCLSGAAAVGAKERIFVDQWSPTRRWVQVWRQAGPRLERVRREELRRLDPQRGDCPAVR